MVLQKRSWLRLWGLLKQSFTERPDMLIAFVAAVIGLVGLTLTLIGKGSFIIQASIIAFPSLLYLILSRHKKGGDIPKVDFPVMSLFPVFLGIMCVGVLLHLYVPSNAMLGISIISFGGVIILVQIHLMGFKHKTLVIAETFLLTLLLRLLPSLSNPGLPGSDPWALSSTSMEILETGHVLPSSAYGNFPIYNILIGEGSIISSIDVRTSTLLMIGFAESFSIFFVYLIAKEVWDYRTGLIASLFYALTPSSIFWGSYPIPMSLGIPLFLLLTGLLFKSIGSDLALLYRSLACLVVVLIVLTHTITSVIAIAVLVGMSLSMYLTKIRSRLPSFKDMAKGIPSFNVIALIALTCTLVYWIYVATGFFSGIAVTVSSILGVYYPKETFIQSYVVPSTLMKMFFDDLGMITLYSLAVVGSFLALAKRETKNALTILTITGVLYVISVIFPSIGIVPSGTILAERWEPFLFAFLVCLSARVLQFIRSSFSFQTVMIIFIVVGLLMIPSVVSYAPENTGRYFSPIYFLPSELDAASWATSHLSSKDLASDGRYSVVLGKGTKDFGHQIISGDIMNVVKAFPNTALLVSKYSFQGGRIIVHKERETFGWSGATLKLPYDLDSFLNDSYYNRFFSNGVVTLYG